MAGGGGGVPRRGGGGGGACSRVLGALVAGAGVVVELRLAGRRLDVAVDVAPARRCLLAFLPLNGFGLNGSVGFGNLPQ